MYFGNFIPLFYHKVTCCKGIVAFQFDINAADGTNHSTWTVLFADSASGSGYIEQPQVGNYSVNITNGNLNKTPNTVFSLNAEMKKDGQMLSNYDDVDYIRWEVLQGSLVIVTVSDHLNRNPQIKCPDLGKNVIRATAIMKNGQSYQSGAITVTVANPVAPTPSTIPTSVPTSTKDIETNLNSNPNSNEHKTDPKATVSPSATPTVKGDKSRLLPVASVSAAASNSADLDSSNSAALAQVSNHINGEDHTFNLIKTIQSFAKSVSGFFSHLWKN